jgi:tetratricopeptide (TPR) repeat protein
MRKKRSSLRGSWAEIGPQGLEKPVFRQVYKWRAKRPSLRWIDAMEIALRTWLGVLVVLIGGAAYARAAEPAALPDVEAELAAPWLVDYGLIYGLNVPQPSQRDAEYILVWLEAATTAAPDFAEAWQWSYDLRSRMGDSAGALEALERYTRAAPDDLLGRFELFITRYDAAQSVEDRIALCTTAAGDSAAPPELRSEAQRRLAELNAGRGDRDEAIRLARSALETLPVNSGARRLLAELEGKLDDPATQIELLLAESAVNPAAALTAWQLANLTSALGITQDAELWFTRTAELLGRGAADGSLPPAFVLDRARAAFDGGRDEDVVRACQEVLQRNPGDVDAAILLIQAARRSGGLQMADEQAQALGARLREGESKAVETRDAGMCMQIARFHLEVMPDAHRALEFARRADEFMPNTPIIRAILGEALVATGDHAKAVEVLTPLAERVPRAAAALARAQSALGDKAAAEKTIRAAERLPAGSAERGRVLNVVRDLGLQPLPPPDRADARAKLAAFDRRILDFPQKAAEFLTLEATVSPSTLAVSTPLYAHIRLTNRGPFPITLGDERMVSPIVSVSVAEEGTAGPALNNYMTIALDKRFVLPPGGTIEADRRISAAAGGPFLNHHPQQRRMLEFRFVLAPETTGSGEIRSSLRDFPMVKQTVTRLATDTSEANLARLRQLVRQGSPAERFGAVETVLALILERYEALQQKKPHTYAAVNVPVETLTADLLGALRDPLPAVRARALGALVFVNPSEKMTQAAAPLITDPHWLPRMLAVELFAKQQGPVFQPVLQKQTGDEVRPVAALAELYLQQIRAR